VNLRIKYQTVLDSPSFTQSFTLVEKDMARHVLALCDTVDELRAQVLTEHSRDVIADMMSEQQEEIERLKAGLRWALQYGIFEVSTDNPLHRHAHEDALKAAGMWDCPHSWSGCDGTRLVSDGHALAAILKEVLMQAKRGTG
jgi:hypothetical protein